MRLEGQVAVVTGAGQGIGRAIALTLAREGAAVVVNDVNLESAKKVAEEIKSRGGKAQPIKADVSNGEEVNTLVEKTLDNFKKIDILVNNAGTAKHAVSPGLTMTELVKTVFKNRPEFTEGVERIPLKRLAEPEDIANAVLFLASPEADYVTGQVLAVDGGTLAVHSRMLRLP